MYLQVFGCVACVPRFPSVLMYGSEIPSEFSSAVDIDIQRISFENIDEMTYMDPLLIQGYENTKFHNLPTDPETLVQYLLRNFGETVVPVSFGTPVTLSEWYENKAGRYLKDWHINQTKTVFSKF